jgi:sulfotransferase famil protein
MAFISESHQFLFIASPRTACTAIAYGVLVPHLGATRIPWDHLVDDQGNILVDSKHGTLRQLVDHDLITREKAASLFKFCAVRNPFDSLVSLYAKYTTAYRSVAEDPRSFIHTKGVTDEFLRAQSMPFSDWVIATYTRPRSPRRLWLRRRRTPRHMYGWFIEGMDQVIRFEHLQDDLASALKRVGVDRTLEVPLQNPTAGRDKDYRSYYTDEARRLVEHVFKPDLDRFGYRF